MMTNGIDPISFILLSGVHVVHKTSNIVHRPSILTLSRLVIQLHYCLCCLLSLANYHTISTLQTLSGSYRSSFEQISRMTSQSLIKYYTLHQQINNQVINFIKELI